MDYYSESLKLHEKHKGKMEIRLKTSIKNKDDLSTVYTPGVAQPCVEIQKDRKKLYKYTAKGNMVAVISDGSAVLGLGNIGGAASLPVMEGKAVLFKQFADVDAIPICLNTQDVEEIIHIIKNITSPFGGINLEDFSAPRCFEIEQRLVDELDIPVFHDDQHGTAIVTSAAVINAYRLLKKPLSEVKVVVSGAGAAGNAIVKMLRLIGIGDIVVCDSKGVISSVRKDSLSRDKQELLAITNRSDISGGLADALVDMDMFIGVSGPNIVSKKMIASMAKDPVIFALSNPEPEIYPSDAFDAGAAIVGTGRSDFPNQINNVLVFPGVFRGALDARAKKVTESMKVSAAYALADVIEEKDLKPDYIIPDAFDEKVAKRVADAVAGSWRE